MALYLKWSDYLAGSAKRIVSNMFSYLSRRWYPVNILGTSIYRMLYMTADQLSSASTEISSTYKDLDLDEVRTTPITSSSDSKIYENFGVLAETSKQNTQNYDSFNNTYKLQSYRTNLKLLNEASLVATTLTGIDKVGQSYIGVAPYTIDRQLLGYEGWSLSVHTGSVVAVGSDFILSDHFIPRVGRVIPVHLGDHATEGFINTINTTITGADRGMYYDVGDLVYVNGGNGDAIVKVEATSPSEGGKVDSVSLHYGGTGGYSVGTGYTTTSITDPSAEGLIIEITGIDTFNVGDTFQISYSKLGYNTKIFSRKHYYSGLDSIIYTTSTTDSLKASINQNITKNVRADVDPRYFYDSTYTIALASGSSTYNTDYFELKTSYVTNKINTTAGEEQGYNSISSSVINTTSSDYHASNLVFDWTCVVKNDAYYDLYLRCYPSASIPDTVYYQKVLAEPIGWMSDTADCGAHWVSLSSASLYDISGKSNNLLLDVSSDVPDLELGRNIYRFAHSMNSITHGSGSTLLFVGDTSKDIDSYGGLTAEMWVSGVDKTFAEGSGLIIIKREAVSTSETELTSDGYLIVIDSTGSVISYISRSGSVVTSASASISEFLLEEPRRYHYFALTLKNNKVKFFADGTLLSTGSITSNSNNATLSPTELYIGNDNDAAYNISVDEIMISSGAVTPKDIEDRFELYAPRYSYPVAIPFYLVDNYYQSKVSTFASGSGDFQYYGCAAKAVDARNFRRKDRSYYNLYHLPLEKI